MRRRSYPALATLRADLDDLTDPGVEIGKLFRLRAMTCSQPPAKNSFATVRSRERISSFGRSEG
jgi:hypothetical protein